MQRLPILSFLLAFLLPLVIADEFDAAPPPSHTATVHAWKLSAPSPIPIVKVSFSPSSRQGSYEPLGEANITDDELVRVGVYNGQAQSWFGSVTFGKSLKNGVVTLRLDADGEIWHVQYSVNLPGASPSTIILKSSAGAAPHLNRPIVLNPDGKISQPEVEKTFFQKYWWLILGGAILLLSGGGGGASE